MEASISVLAKLGFVMGEGQLVLTHTGFTADVVAWLIRRVSILCVAQNTEKNPPPQGDPGTLDNMKPERGMWKTPTALMLVMLFIG